MPTERGIVYTALGADYVRLATTSAKSLKSRNADLHVTLFTDQPNCLPAVGSTLSGPLRQAPENGSLIAFSNGWSAGPSRPTVKPLHSMPTR